MLILMSLMGGDIIEIRNAFPTRNVFKNVPGGDTFQRHSSDVTGRDGGDFFSPVPCHKEERKVAIVY